MTEKRSGLEYPITPNPYQVQAQLYAQNALAQLYQQVGGQQYFGTIVQASHTDDNLLLLIEEDV